MTKKELEKATGQELIEQRDYCGVDGYYGDYLDNVNAEMLKRFNYLAELEAQIEKMKCCGNCKYSNQEGAYSIVCKVGGVDKTDYINIDDNQVCDKWELREIKENGTENN